MNSLTVKCVLVAILEVGLLQLLMENRHKAFHCPLILHLRYVF